MKIAIDVAGFTPAESDGFRRAMGTWRSSREMEKLHAAVRRRLHRQQRPDRGAGGGAVPPGRGVRQLRLQQEPCRGVRADRVRVGVPEALLPGAVRGRADQRAADGLLPGGGADQRREAPRRRGPAGGREPESRYRTTTEWVGHARRGPCPRRSRSPRAAASTGGPPVRSPRASSRRARRAATGRRTSTRLRHPARAASGQGHRRGAGGGARRGDGARGPFRSLADLVARTELSEEVVERLIRAGALDSLGQPRRELLWQLREVAGATRGRVDGRTRVDELSREAAGRPLDLRLPPTQAPTCRHQPSSSGWATPTRSSRSTRDGR